MGMPVHTSDGATFLPTSLDLMVHLASLPVPEADIATAVTRSKELTIRRDLEVDSIPGSIMPNEALLPVLTEFVRRAVDDDLVVA